jgi:transposase
MSLFHGYEPDQAMLLPPNVRDVLGADHLCFHVHRVIEALAMGEFERAYASEGRLAYPPRMMLKVWLYAFCIGVASTRRLEQRIREDLAFRYWAGGLGPNHKTLSAEAPGSDQRRVHAGVGAGAASGDGEVGARGD